MAAKSDFTLNDFRKQLEQLETRDGSHVEGSMLGVDALEDSKTSLLRIRDMIDSMTEEERRDPDCIDLSHRSRIAAESGAQLEEVEQFLEQFKQIRILMRRMAQMSIWERIKMATGFTKFLPPHAENDE